MKKNLVYLIVLLTVKLCAQNVPYWNNQANWQQLVDYKIKVTLNESERTLNGFESIVYTNKSPDALDRIYMHVWPNAYKNRSTAFAKQQIQHGNTKFHFAKSEDRGYIDSLAFVVNGLSVKWQLTDSIDVAVIWLSKPLLPGESILIETPFKVKLPFVFSRGGVANDIFCVTQWYPKPAVYDVHGWNPMPYLDQGEFYSEFGNFDVEITLPSEMKLAATGDLQDTAELNWLHQLSENTALKSPFGSTKTLRYIQKNVHDFAWFASKKFNVIHRNTFLPSGKTVKLWLFAVNANDDGLDFMESGIKFYSKQIGEYPYNQATVVITPLEAGGGMEYPTITNCQDIDETTIVHELGHNWFYGILGSNERLYPWMDESLNTFYENWHSEGKKDQNIEVSSSLSNVVLNLNAPRVLYLYGARNNQLQSGLLRSEEYTSHNYGAVVYTKNPLAFFYLKSYLGDSIFTLAMKTYYEKWMFKHPLPKDFKDVFETVSGKNLNWFFNGTLHNDRWDVTLKPKKVKLNIAQFYDAKGPVPISIMRNKEAKSNYRYCPDVTDSVLTTFWVEPNAELNLDSLKTISGSKDFITVNSKIQPLEIYSQNNFLYLKSGKVKAPLKLGFLLNLENENRTDVFFTPTYGYNIYNGNMLGVAFYNSLFPRKRNEFVLAPFYAFGSNNINGYFEYKHHWLLYGKIKRITAGINLARFGSEGLVTTSNNADIKTKLNSFGSYYTDITFEKVAPFFQMELKPKNEISNIRQTINLRYVAINEQYINEGYYKNLSELMGIADLSYNYNNPAKLYPASFEANYQKGLQNSFVHKLSFTYQQGFLYKDGKKTADIRLFGGMFLEQFNTNGNTQKGLQYQRSVYQAGGNLGSNDYFYDFAMIGRGQNNPDANIWGRQVLYRDAGFRNFISLGGTDSWIVSTNITIPAPIGLPIGLYGDACYAHQLTTQTDKNFVLSGGIYVAFAKNAFAWYIPFYFSNNVEDVYKTQYPSLSNPFARSSFIININKLNPIAAIRNIKL